MKIQDAKLRMLYQQISGERASDPSRQIEDKDLVDLFAAVADRRGTSFAKAQTALRGAATLDQKVALTRPGMTATEKADLEGILWQGTVPISPAAKKAIEKLLGGPTPPAPTPTTPAVFGVKAGRMGFALHDDRVISTADGNMSGSAGVPAFSRSYVAKTDGVLRQRHGTPVPASNIHSPQQTKALDDRTPGTALDTAAKAFGVSVKGFEKMAVSPEFYDPTAQSWEGLCHAWSWAACSKTACSLVDVDGPSGLQGRWIGGQWLSRADLGNWMMAVSHVISQSASEKLWDDDVTPLDLLKVAGQYLMNDGGGIVADIHSDKATGTQERWNQPFVGADISVKTIGGQTGMALIGQAVADGIKGGVSAKHVNMVGHYADEQADDHEGPTSLGTRDWHLYTIHDKDGVAIAAYMAHDPKLAHIAGLPTQASDELPDYVLRPRVDAIDEVIKGKSVWYVDEDDYGAEFTFFVATALAKGVPGYVRADFEKDLAALPAGKLSAADQTMLAGKYGAAGLANAYAPDEWAQSFAARGLDAKAFGAAWPVV